MATADHVVLYIDQQNPNNHPSMLEIDELKEHNIPLEKKSLSFSSAPDHHQNPRRIKTINRLSFSKPKARLQELNYPATAPNKTIPESHEVEAFLDDDDDDDENDEWDKELQDDEDDEEMGTKKWKKNKRKFNWRLLVELVMFFIIMTSLISSLITIKPVKKWGIEIWKWCLMVMVTFCGRLVSTWVMGFAVLLIERNFMLREKVLYFVYGLRNSIRNCIWLGLVLIAWTCMFNAKLHKKNKMLKKVFQGLVAVLLGATIWLIKIALVKVLASTFHVTTYFDRMKESVFHHYILETLSGPPMEENPNPNPNPNPNLSGSKSLPVKWKEGRKMDKSMKRMGSRKMDMEKLRKLSMEGTATAWSMKRLVSYIKSSGLSTISQTVDYFGKAESEISSEWEARNSAQRVFKNVAKPGAKYIEEEDLMRFLKRVEVHTIFPHFEGALETGRITQTSFRNWVVRAYFERKALAHSLNDTKTAVQQLHKLASAVVIVIIVVVSLLVMELATTKVIFFVLTQLVLVGFMFQNTCKMVFESIIFIFVMHPFDIGDRCVIDGVQMIVEEMNILTTVFLRYDMEKIYYPNAVLLTKPISNFYRSPEMSDNVNFTVDISTSMDTIIALKKAIQVYIESKPKYWNPKHSVIVKEIAELNKLKMCLCVQHTINHQNYGERSNRISELILELKKIFENLGIKYHLLPQEIHLTPPQLEHPIFPFLIKALCVNCCSYVCVSVLLWLILKPSRLRIYNMTTLCDSSS